MRSLVKRKVVMRCSMISLIVILSVSFLVVPSACKRTELLKNGGFEDGLDNWSVFSYYPEHNDKAVVADSKSHFGRYSLETSIVDKSQGQLGRGARQTILVRQCSNLQLSFWVYLGSVTGSQNLHTDIALIVSFLTEKSPKMIAYYAAWDPREEIYDGFPAPTMNSENVTNMDMPAMMIYKWNHVERDLAGDFKNSYPSIDLRTVSSVSIELVSVRFQKNDFVIETFWDDISLTCDSEETALWSESPTPTQSLEQTQQTTIATNPPPKPSEELTETATTAASSTGIPTKTPARALTPLVDYWTPLTAVATIMGSLLAMMTLFFTFRRRN